MNLHGGFFVVVLVFGGYHPSFHHSIIPSSHHPIIPSSIIPSSHYPIIPSSHHPIIPSSIIPSSHHPHHPHHPHRRLYVWACNILNKTLPATLLVLQHNRLTARPPTVTSPPWHDAGLKFGASCSPMFARKLDFLRLDKNSTFVWFRWFSFSKGWFSGSIISFLGSTT